MWRLNDSWPIIYWSVIDYYLEPKIPFYYLRRSYLPVLVSFERTADRICVWVSNDSANTVSGRLYVTQKDFNGNVIAKRNCEVSLQSGMSRRCLDLTELGLIRLRNHFLEATLNGETVTSLLIGERYLKLPRAKLVCNYKDGRIELISDKFARQVSIEMPGISGAVFEDNYFDLSPGNPKSIRLIDRAGGGGLIIQALNSEVCELTL